MTFLFTDIEGSTKLAREFPREWPALIAAHNAILQQAIEACHGSVYQVVGDSFAAAFHNASAALNAALQAQRSLYEEAWSQGCALSMDDAITLARASESAGA